MKKQTALNNPDKVIETSTIRLTSEETRAVMSAQAHDGKANGSYHCHSLIGLGIMKKIKAVPDERVETQKKECWEKILRAAQKQDTEALDRSLNALRAIERKQQESCYILSALGKQVARGLSVRLGAQKF